MKRLNAESVLSLLKLHHGDKICWTLASYFRVSAVTWQSKVRTNASQSWRPTASLNFSVQQAMASASVFALVQSTGASPAWASAALCSEEAVTDILGRAGQEPGLASRTVQPLINKDAMAINRILFIFQF